jgi:hypothetical protein
MTEKTMSENAKKLVLFDLDGTVSNDEERFKYLPMSADGDFEEYHRLCAFDKPFDKTFCKMLEFMKNPENIVGFLTMRPPSMWSATKFFLNSSYRDVMMENGKYTKEEHLDFMNYDWVPLFYPDAPLHIYADAPLHIEGMSYRLFDVLKAIEGNSNFEDDDYRERVVNYKAFVIFAARYRQNRHNERLYTGAIYVDSDEALLRAVTERVVWFDENWDNLKDKVPSKGEGE